jgi:hypothetical protein
VLAFSHENHPAAVMEPAAATFNTDGAVTGVTWPASVDPTAASRPSAEARGVRKEKALQLWRTEMVRKHGRVPKCASPGCSVMAVFWCEAGGEDRYLPARHCHTCH